MDRSTEPVRSVLSLLSEADRKVVDDDTVRRYLRAYVGDAKAAARALVATLRWRAETRPHERSCGACGVDPRSHNLRVVGIDSFERPVLYTCFSQAMNRFSATDNVDHLIRSMEDSIAIMNSRAASGQGNPGSWVFVVDYHGYSWLVDTNPRTALLAVQMLAHYPERLGRCIMIDAPSAFAGTWHVVRGVLNEVTKGKIVFARSDDGSLAQELSCWADASLKSWLLAEVSENRRERNQAGRKLYWVAPHESGRAHDPRATVEFLSSPEFQLTLTSRLARGPQPIEMAEREAVKAWTQGAPVLLALVGVLLWVSDLAAAAGALLLCTGLCFLAPRFGDTSAVEPKLEPRMVPVEEPSIKPVATRPAVPGCCSCFGFC